MSAGHCEAHRLHTGGVGIYWRPDCITKDDVALPRLLTTCHQNAVLTGGLHTTQNVTFWYSHQGIRGNPVSAGSGYQHGHRLRQPADVRERVVLVKPPRNKRDPVQRQQISA